MGTIFVQNDFSHGELNRQGFSKIDTIQYKKSAAVISNMVVKSLGQASRRFGTEYIATITATEDEYLLHKFRFNSLTDYLLVFTNNNIAVYRDKVFKFDITSTYTGAEVSDLQFSQVDNQLVIVHQDHAQAQLVRGASDVLWTLSDITFKNPPAHDFDQDYDAITFTLASVVPAKNINLTSSSAIFSAGDVGGTFVGYGDDDTETLGRAVIDTFTSTTAVKVTIQKTFSASFTAGVIGTQVILSEPAWTASHGFPGTVAFFQGRLWFGGTTDLPLTMFGSKSLNTRDYNLGRGLDDDAIQETITNDKSTIIKHLVSSITLQVFTDSAELSSIPNSLTPLTPGSSSFILQSAIGSGNVPPLVTDNVTLYSDNGGNRIYAFLYNEQAQFYNSNVVSTFSSQLIDDPVDTEIHIPTTSDESKFYFIVNSDGTLTAYQTIASENVSAFTGNSTDGEFKRVTDVGGDLYFLIKRTINSVDVTYLELKNEDFLMDSMKIQTFGGGATVITGLGHLEGESVYTIGDNYLLPAETVASSQITIDKSSVEVATGINFTNTLTLLPINVFTQKGPIAYQNTKITKVWVDVFESLGVIIDGSTPIPDLEFGATVLDQIPISITGLFETTLMGGWDPRQQLTLTVDLPLKCTILGVGVEITTQGP